MICSLLPVPLCKCQHFNYVPLFNELISKPAVKEQLKNNTNEAIEAGIFGVPTLVANKEIFWGFDATDMLLDYLKNPGLFEHPEMQRVSNLLESAQRKIH